MADHTAVAPWLPVLVAAAVATVWTVLLGAAWIARVRLGLGRATSFAVVAGCYLGFAAAAVAVIGPTPRGLLGAAGMLVPLAVAAALVLRAGR